MPLGTCRLCLNNSDLVQSHLIPAAVYKLLNSPNAPNPNPILLTSRVRVQTSREIKDYLLCRNCEEVLNVSGENWVLPRLATGTAFPLYDALTAVAPDVVEPGVAAYAASKNPAILVEDITHFALGIFWKASVHSWRHGSSPSNVSKIELGPYAEHMRNFLRAGAPFPEHIALGVNIMPPPVTTRLSLTPRKGRKTNNVHRFHMYVPGVSFSLFVGGGVTTKFKDVCFYCNPLHPILVCDSSEEIERHPREMYFKVKAASRA